MNDPLRYFGCTLMVCLMLFATGRAQEKDSLVIHFDVGRSVLRPDARAAIDSVLSGYGTAHPLGRIALSGHCDGIGGNVYNDRLSLSRLKTARDYLRSRVLSDSFFLAMNAYGKRRPLNDNGDADKRSLNRRVEIIFYAIPRTSASPPASVDASPPATLRPAPSTDRRPMDQRPIDQTPPPVSLSEFFRDSAHTGKTYILRNLNFVSGRHVLMPYSDTVLKELLRIMLDSPDLKIEIRGHVCCIAEWLDGLDSETNTNDLSVRRARFVYAYLRQGGVKATRMTYRGFGASIKLYPEERNEQEQERNRRVEIKVVSRGRATP